MRRWLRWMRRKNRPSHKTKSAEREREMGWKEEGGYLILIVIPLHIVFIWAESEDGCGSFFARRTESFFDFNTPRPVRLTRLSPSIGLANRLGVRISHYWTARMAAEPSSARTTPPVISEECTGGLLKKRRQCPLAANFRPLWTFRFAVPPYYTDSVGSKEELTWPIEILLFFYQHAHKNIFLLYFMKVLSQGWMPGIKLIFRKVYYTPFLNHFLMIVFKKIDSCFYIWPEIDHFLIECHLQQRWRKHQFFYRSPKVLWLFHLHLACRKLSPYL